MFVGNNDFSPNVCIIGGANVDIIGIPEGSFTPRDSNPGRVSISCGGVGRNIAENLSHLGITTSFITALGDDLNGELILNQSAISGINMEGSIIISNHSTSVYLAILDENRDMLSAVSHMDIYEKMTPVHLEKQRGIIDSCDLCLLDTNLPKYIIEYILESFTPGAFMLDTVSSSKALRASQVLGHFHTIKPNRVEAEALWGKPIRSMEEAFEACRFFISLGIRQVFITLGQNGVCFSNGSIYGHFISPPSPIANATGAGDAFSAALAYCYLKGYTLENAARFASAAATITLAYEKTICPNLCVDSINRIIKEWKI
jgi:pseudouridine kinase